MHNICMHDNGPYIDKIFIFTITCDCSRSLLADNFSKYNKLLQNSLSELNVTFNPLGFEKKAI